MSLTQDEVLSGDFQDISDNNFQQMKNKVTKLGYADGVAEGRDSVFQKGFDQGYKDGLLTSLEIEKYRNFFKNLNMEKLENSCLQQEKEEFDKLQVNESKDADHFQYVKHKGENLDVISKKQREYVGGIAQKFEKKMPFTSSLLKIQPSTHNV